MLQYGVQGEGKRLMKVLEGVNQYRRKKAALLISLASVSISYLGSGCFSISSRNTSSFGFRK